MPMYRVRTIFTGVAGTPYYSNIYFTQEGGTVAQARLAVSNFWASNAGLISSNITSFVEYEVAIIDEATGDVVSVSSDLVTYQFQGSRGESPLPYQNQFLVRARTGVFNGGREIRGRIFIPGPTEISISGGDVLPTARNALQTNAGELMNAENAQWVIWAKSKGSYAVVNSVNVWSKFAVLRSRRD